MNAFKDHVRNFFHTQELFVFRYREGATWKDRKCKTLEEARTLAFRKKMNQPGTDYQILKAIQDSMFKRILKLEIRLPGFIQIRGRVFRKPIRVYWIALFFVAVCFARHFLK